jgi:hypothetical protein
MKRETEKLLDEPQRIVAYLDGLPLRSVSETLRGRRSPLRWGSCPC